MYVPALIPVVAKSIVILPELTTGVPVVTNLVLLTGVTPMLVTVPEPPPPPVELMVTFPLAWFTVILVPAIILVTPLFKISTVPAILLLVTVIPVLPLNVLYGLALVKSVLKLVLVLLNAVYRVSLPADSLGSPILIICCPVIAILNPLRNRYKYLC